jgi:hypothetical protein
MILHDNGVGRSEASGIQEEIIYSPYQNQHLLCYDDEDGKR